jgi:hypothetical protein
MTNIQIKITRTVLPAPNREMRRVRKWGDPAMVEWGFDVNQAGTSNFQAVRCWNDGNRTFGAVTNYLYIPHAEVMKLRDMQFAEHTDRGYFDEFSKMEWLCGWRGSLYMYDHESDDWQISPKIRWGTLTLGGNLVQVERYETMRLRIGDRPLQDYEMARLVGFRRSDWNRPLEELIEDGLVHYCYCAYFPNNGFGHTPKGVIYSPFFSPQDYDFVGTAQPGAFYVPTNWLEPK